MGATLELSAWQFYKWGASHTAYALYIYYICIIEQTNKQK